MTQTERIEALTEKLLCQICVLTDRPAEDYTPLVRDEIARCEASARENGWTGEYGIADLTEYDLAAIRARLEEDARLDDQIEFRGSWTD
jgi:hypothetical protein